MIEGAGACRQLLSPRPAWQPSAGLDKHRPDIAKLREASPGVYLGDLLALRLSLFFFLLHRMFEVLDALA
jgi:hypothetical protein